jgi:hypothetical protein
MRVLLVLFGLGASASAAVALHEVRADASHRDAIVNTHTPTPVAAPEPEQPRLTTRGPLPFGQVPREPIDPPAANPRVTITGEDITIVDNDSGEDIVDRVDRCPDAPENNEGYEDIDGCPDVENTVEITPTVQVYNGPAPQRRVIRLNFNEIID